MPAISASRRNQIAREQKEDRKDNQDIARQLKAGPLATGTKARAVNRLGTLAREQADQFIVEVRQR